MELHQEGSAVSAEPFVFLSYDSTIDGGICGSTGALTGANARPSLSPKNSPLSVQVLTGACVGRTDKIRTCDLYHPKVAL